MFTPRFSAALVAGLTVISLRLQFDVLRAAQPDLPVSAAVWIMAGYFTVLTNTLVAASMMATAWGYVISSRWTAALVVSIVMVGIVDHTVLAWVWAPVGLAWWADQGLHTAVPMAMLAWWVAFSQKDIGWGDLLWWLIWPLLYCVYAVWRGVVTGFWAYPFVDIDALGGFAVARNCLGLVMAFCMLGSLLILAARRLAR